MGVGMGKEGDFKRNPFTSNGKKEVRGLLTAGRPDESGRGGTKAFPLPPVKIGVCLSKDREG